MARRSARQTRIVPHLAPQTIITEATRSAWKPFRELAKRGVPPSLIELFMFKLMVRQWIRKRTDWDEPKSMKRHTLKRFPARIQQMAQDIEALNADPVLGPVDVLLPGNKQTQGVGRNLVEEIRDRTTRERKQLARRLHELPAVLAEYAIYLSSISDLVGRIRRHPCFWRIRILPCRCWSQRMFLFHRNQSNSFPSRKMVKVAHYLFAR